MAKGVGDKGRGRARRAGAAVLEGLLWAVAAGLWLLCAWAVLVLGMLWAVPELVLWAGSAAGSFDLAVICLPCAFGVLLLAWGAVALLRWVWKGLCRLKGRCAAALRSKSAQSAAGE